MFSIAKAFTSGSSSSSFKFGLVLPALASPMGDLLKIFDIVGIFTTIVLTLYIYPSYNFLLQYFKGIFIIFWMSISVLLPYLLFMLVFLAFNLILSVSVCEGSDELPVVIEFNNLHLIETLKEAPLRGARPVGAG